LAQNAFNDIFQITLNNFSLKHKHDQQHFMNDKNSLHMFAFSFQNCYTLTKHNIVSYWTMDKKKHQILWKWWDEAEHQVSVFSSHPCRRGKCRNNVVLSIDVWHTLQWIIRRLESFSFC